MQEDCAQSILNRDLHGAGSSSRLRKPHLLTCSASAAFPGGSLEKTQAHEPWFAGLSD
jgi:hypothetical protein